MVIDVSERYRPNVRQALFHACGADEAVYGGAKGGGKSCALVMEALAYGLEHPGAEMYIFRRTFDDLESGPIREWREKVPSKLYRYNASKYQALLINGTGIRFRYLAGPDAAAGYNGRSIDWIGVDELTQHEEESIQTLLSCLRSPKGFPPRFRGTCNPGGIGHHWVKQRYIEATRYGERAARDPVTGSSIAFIPAKVYDNTVLMENDPGYVRRLLNLPESRRRAYLDGDWDIFEGQYFTEWDRAVHVTRPFAIPASWRRYFTLDYGLDMLAGYWVAVDGMGRAFIYRELYRPGLIISDAARAILEATPPGERIEACFAPPDLWNRRQDTGRSAAEIFAGQGLVLTPADNQRVQGWYDLREWLKPRLDEQGERSAYLSVFSNCDNLIRCLPQLQHDEKNPDDVADSPHELTHGPDAIRYFIAGRPSPAAVPEPADNERPSEQAQVESLLEYGR